MPRPEICGEEEDVQGQDTAGSQSEPMLIVHVGAHWKTLRGNILTKAESMARISIILFKLQEQSLLKYLV